MIRRNLAFHEDIPTDALRQRRDMYVLAIGLLIFNLAGGSLITQSTSGILSVNLRHPHIVLWAAWVGFFYFWWRFWLVSKARPFADFVIAANWQLGNTLTVRKIAAPSVTTGAGTPSNKRRDQLLSPTGPVPKATMLGAKISLQGVQMRSGDTFTHHLGPEDIAVPAAMIWAFRRAKVVALYRTITCERVFTDYTLPHLFAACTVVVGVWRLIPG